VDGQLRPRGGGREGSRQGGPEVGASARTLPLPDDLAAALTALHKRQTAERLAAGETYRASGYVVCDELGEAVNPEWLSDESGRVRDQAGVRRITLHETRHTAASLMEKAGVPDSIRAAWCGYTVAVSKATYTHALPGTWPTAVPDQDVWAPGTP
jgi:integrase